MKILPFCFIMYWNDKEVLQKLGAAMGVPVPGDAAGGNEAGGVSEDESAVHHTASVGDVEVIFFIYIIFSNIIFK